MPNYNNNDARILLLGTLIRVHNIIVLYVDAALNSLPLWVRNNAENIPCQNCDPNLIDWGMEDPFGFSFGTHYDLSLPVKKNGYSGIQLLKFIKEIDQRWELKKRTLTIIRRCIFWCWLYHPFCWLSCKQLTNHQFLYSQPWKVSLGHILLKNSPLNFLFLLALLLFLSGCVNSISSLTSPLPANISSGASIAASETATGATYHRKIIWENILE